MMRVHGSWIWGISLMLWVGCTPPSDDSDDDLVDEPLPAEPIAHWCEAGLGGGAGTRAEALDIARVHVGQRIFGPTAAWLEADSALIPLVEETGPSGGEWLHAYADAFPDVCTMEAVSGEVPNASVEQQGTVAIVSPGTGELSLPDGVETVVVDLRNAHPNADVASALSLAIAGDLQLGVRKVRKFMGFPSQEEGWTHFETKVLTQPITLQGTAETDLPLVVLVDSQLSPEAARWTGGLRLEQRAVLVGSDVYSAVGESTWTGVGDQGLMWRSSQLEREGQPWPDVISADVSTSTHDWYVDRLNEVALVEGEPGPVERTRFKAYNREAGQHNSTLSQGAMRAALMVAYGTADWFYPYFEIVGRDVDDAYLAQLDKVAELEAGDRSGMMALLGTLMHGLHDGHGYYYDWATTDWEDGYLIIQLQEVAGEPVIRTSSHPGLNAGDTIVEIDGVTAEEWYAEAESRYSGSSDGYRFVMASDELKQVWGSRQLRLRSPSGEERDVNALPEPWSKTGLVPWGGSLRPNGWLDDLGAPTVYYVNMSADVTPEVDVVTDIFGELMSADGIVLDMRDYPYLDIYGFAGYFNPSNYTAPLFDFPTWTGAEMFEWEQEVWSFTPASKVYTGPVVLMVSNYSVSAAECFAQMIVPLDNVTVVGQQSASTNGTITNLWLPGQFQIYFTGMRLLNPDGSTFHGIGIQPDVVVVPSPADLAAGIDPELEAAVTALGQ